MGSNVYRSFAVQSAPKDTYTGNAGTGIYDLNCRFIGKMVIPLG